jgi:hypothetical protein
MTKKRAIIEGDKIFTEVAKSVSWTETQSLEQATPPAFARILRV